MGWTNYLLKTSQFKRICPTQACIKPVVRPMADKLQVLVTEKWGLKLLVIVITLARVAEYRQHGRSHGLYGR